MRFRRDDISNPFHTTCTWLSHHTFYLEWLQQRHGPLWIKGKAGSGKSTLLKHALIMAEQEKRHNSVIVSWFFNGRGAPMQKNLLGLYMSLLHQLLRHFPEQLDILTSTFNRRCVSEGPFGEKWQWGEGELQETLGTFLVNAAKTHDLRMYIDALDECGEESAVKLITFFKHVISLLNSNTSGSLNICFSCRHYPILTLENGLEICVKDENTQDIQTFVKNMIDKCISRKKIMVEIQDAVMKRSSGIFQWVVLVVAEVLKLDRKGKSVGDIKKIIEEIPPDLKDLYANLFQSLSEEDKPQTLHLMQWVFYAFRPLSVGELRDAMILAPDTPYTSLTECRDAQGYTECDETMDTERRICDLSRGLIEVDGNVSKRTVQFIHQSVKDFMLERGFHLLDETFTTTNSASRGHFWISRSCLKYLSMDELRAGCSRIKQIQASRLIDGTVLNQECKLAYADIELQCPFVDYSTRNWIKHVVEVEKEQKEHLPQSDLLSFFFTPPGLLDTWNMLHWAVDNHSSYDTIPTFLHLVAENGLLSILDDTLDTAKVDVNCLDRHDSTPLMLAVSAGHENIVRVLLKRDSVQLDRQNYHFRTALEIAIEEGYTTIASLLIDQKVTHPWWGLMPGIFCIRRRTKRNKRINAQDYKGRTPLFLAMEQGLWDATRLLIQNGADKDLKDEDGYTALGISILSGQVLDDETQLIYNDDLIEIHMMPYGREYTTSSLRKLLEQNVKINNPTLLGRQALVESIKGGLRNVVKVLLELGVDVNAVDEYGNTPLAQCIREHPKSVEMLIELGVELNARYSNRKTLLMKAVKFILTWANWDSSAFVEGVSLLVNAGAEINARDNDGNTILHHTQPITSWIVEREVVEISRGLIEIGASISIKNTEGKTPLDVLLSQTFRKNSEYYELVELLSHGDSPREMATSHT